MQSLKNELMHGPTCEQTTMQVSTSLQETSTLLHHTMITDTTLEGLSMAEMTGIESTELPQETPPKLLEMSFESPSRVTMEMKEPQGFKQEEEEEVGEDEGGVEEDVVVVSSKQGSGDAVVQETKRKNLTDQERVAIVHYLLANSAAGRLKHGDMKTAATHFGVHRATIRRLWKMHTASSVTDGLAGNVASRIKGHSGRKPKVPDEELKVRIAAIPVERRMTGRGLSTALQVSNSVVVRLIKSGKLRRHPKKLHYVM